MTYYIERQRRGDWCGDWEPVLVYGVLTPEAVEEAEKITTRPDAERYEWRLRVVDNGKTTDVREWEGATA